MNLVTSSGTTKLDTRGKAGSNNAEFWGTRKLTFGYGGQVAVDRGQRIRKSYLTLDPT